MKLLRPLAVVLLTGLLTGAAIPADAQEIGDKLSTFFVGRLAFGENQGNDCGDVGYHLVQLVGRASTIQTHEERKLDLEGDDLFETPFLFMNGHNDFVLDDAELENLRKYFLRGGFLFASGCCTNPEFPRAWRRELGRVFPGESVREISYDHLIYRAFYEIENVRSLSDGHDIHLEGLFLDGELLAVLGEDGLCCAFAMEGSCNLGQGVPPEDARKLSLNVAVYALTH